MVTNRQPPKEGDLVGRRIGGYTIERLIGAGGMGSVYLAVSSRLGRKMAIKVIAREYTQDPEIVGRFFREAMAIAALDDPNIIDIYDCHEFAEDGLTYISMKFIDGHSLAALSRLTGRMAIETAVAITVQIASGLDAAHELGIVHRDIKPENVLISSRWRRRFFATILDFGIAKLLDPVLAANYRTKASVVMGTLYYMAPEQARADRNIDLRADIYALGVVLYELLTGRRPYNEETVYGLVEKQQTRTPFPRPRELRTDIPQVIDELLLDMLQVDRNKRPASMKEVGQRLVQGVLNGELMLRTLAARLSLDRPTTPNEPTLVGDVESSITRWTPARSMLHGRRPALVPLALAIVGGAAIGAVAMKLAVGKRAEEAVATAPDRGSTTPSGASGALDRRAAESAPVAESRPDAGVLIATVGRTDAAPPVDAAIPPDARPDAPVTAARLGATIPGDVAPPDAGIVAVEHHPVKPEPRPAKPPAKPPEPSANAGPRTGTLVIRTRTSANVWIDGIRSDSAPVRLENISVGRHIVLLVNDVHRETVTVNVGAKTETVIEKSW